MTIATRKPQSSDMSQSTFSVYASAPLRTGIMDNLLRPSPAPAQFQGHDSLPSAVDVVA